MQSNNGTASLPPSGESKQTSRRRRRNQCPCSSSEESARGAPQTTQTRTSPPSDETSNSFELDEDSWNKRLLPFDTMAGSGDNALDIPVHPEEGGGTPGDSASSLLREISLVSSSHNSSTGSSGSSHRSQGQGSQNDLIGSTTGSSATGYSHSSTSSAGIPQEGQQETSQKSQAIRRERIFTTDDPSQREDYTQVLPITIRHALACVGQAPSPSSMVLFPDSQTSLAAATAVTLPTREHRHRTKATTSTHQEPTEKAKAKERNAREQIRAQRIADVIENIKDMMEGAGQELERRSKYHVLARCVKYLREAATGADEKEQANQLLRTQLKHLEEKLQEKPSRDAHDSVTSSLTSSNSEQASDVAGYSRKRDHSPNQLGSQKKASVIVSLNESTSGGSRESYSTRQQARMQMLHSNEEAIGPGADKESTHSETVKMAVQSDSNSIVSDAAVKNEEGLYLPPWKRDVQGDRDSTDSDSSASDNPPMPEVVTLERSPILDYESIFLQSSIPQVISLPSGQLVVCNKAFLEIAGVRTKQTKKITLFSLISIRRLPDLFKALSDDLLSGPKENTDSNDLTSLGGGQRRVQLQRTSFKALTLPCVDFPLKQEENTIKLPSLYVTISLLGNADSKKQCMHCVFSNSIGTNGKVNALTPALLKSIFSSR